MSGIPMVTIWKGVPLEDLTRDDLIKAINYMLQVLEDERSRHQASLEIMNAALKRRNN